MIVMKRRKVTTICWETSICFYLVLKIAYFSWTSVCVEKTIVWILSLSFCRIVKDAIKVLPPVLPYSMKFHKRHVLFKGFVWNNLFFCTIVMKIRKLTPTFWENSLFLSSSWKLPFFHKFVWRKRLFELFCILFCNISQIGNKFDSGFTLFVKIL